MIEEYLKNKGAKFEVVRHELAYTAQETAATEHVTGYEFAKTVIVTDGDSYYMLVLPAPYHVDMKKAKKLIGKKVKLASEKKTGPLFSECEVGAEPPFGSVFDIPTYVDETLCGQGQIVFRAGTHEKTIKMSCDDYCELEQPTVGSFAAGA